MAFQFALSPVLWLRELAEEREEKLLQRILKEIAATEELIDEADAELAAANKARRAELARRCDGVHLLAWYEHIEELRRKRSGFAQKLEKLDELRDKQMQAYTAARSSRQILDRMRDRERAVYDGVAGRREQSRLDDSFGARRARRNPHR